MRRIIRSSVAFPALLYFFTLSPERYFFRGGNLLNIKCVLILSKLLSEAFLILRRIQRVLSQIGPHVDYQLFVSNCNEI